MLYMERKPHPALAPFVKMLWYACDANAVHGHQRVLPTGRAEIVISLARDYLTDANHPTDPLRHSGPALFLGPYSRYQMIDAIDLAEMMGVSFHPGGTMPFFREDTQVFANCETALTDMWGSAAEDLRDQLREAPSPEMKFARLEAALMERLGRALERERHRVVDFALSELHRAGTTAAIAELTRSIGISPRRFSQLFGERVGVSPKLYFRIVRFQHAVRRLHKGDEIPWVELAQECGYYDQSHFSNDFRVFSGVSPTTYNAAQRPWANHLIME